MGNYERTENLIQQKTHTKKEFEQILNCTEDEDTREMILNELDSLDISIGELRGYLEELASIDGYVSYEEMQEEMQKEENCEEPAQYKKQEDELEL